LNILAGSASQPHFEIGGGNPYSGMQEDDIINFVRGL